MGKSEVIMSLMEFSEIDNGQYKVKVYLNNAGIDVTQDNQIQEGVGRINEGATNEMAKVAFNSRTKTLKYISETLVPPLQNIGKRKRKLLFILGNPATHSITNRMFFFSKNNGERHGFWGKLANNCLLENFELETRKQEAERRRNLILTGNTNHEFVIGFTTFYSLPTPTGIDGNPYCDSKGVEKFFNSISLLERIKEEEFNRINGYPFANNAIWITTIKSAYNYLLEKNIPIDRVKYWPIRDNGSGWKKLREILT